MDRNTHTIIPPSHSLALSFKEWKEVDLRIILWLRATSINTVLEYVFACVSLRVCVCLKVVLENRLKMKIQRGTVRLENKFSNFRTILILPQSTSAGENA